jgi:hypothetical protein
MKKIKQVFTPNRIAAISGILAAIAAFVTTLETNLVPGSPATEAIAKGSVMLSAVAAVWGIIVKFMEGSQNWDSLSEAGVPKASGMTVVQNVITPDSEELPLAPATSEAQVQGFTEQ